MQKMKSKLVRRDGILKSSTGTQLDYCVKKAFLRTMYDPEWRAMVVYNKDTDELETIDYHNSYSNSKTTDNLIEIGREIDSADMFVDCETVAETNKVIVVEETEFNNNMGKGIDSKEAEKYYNVYGNVDTKYRVINRKEAFLEWILDDADWYRDLISEMYIELDQMFNEEDPDAD